MEWLALSVMANVVLLATSVVLFFIARAAFRAVAHLLQELDRVQGENSVELLIGEQGPCFKVWRN